MGLECKRVVGKVSRLHQQPQSLLLSRTNLAGAGVVKVWFGPILLYAVILPLLYPSPGG